MQISKTARVASILVFSFMKALWAQEVAQQPSVVSLDDLIQEALQNRPGLKADKELVVVKEAQIGPQSSLEDPMLGFAATNYPVDSFRSDQFGMTGNEFSLTQKLPFPGKRSALKSGATKEYEAAKQEYGAASLSLIRDVKIAFFKLYLAHDKLRLLNDQVSIVRSILSTLRSRYTTGAIPQAELLSVQLEEASLLNEIIGATQEIDVRIGDLNHAVGRSEHHAIGRPEGLPQTQFPAPLNEKSFGERAIAHNPKLSSLQTMVGASDAEVSYARRGYLPDLEFRAAYMQRDPSPGDPGTDFFSGGVGISLPIFAYSKQSEEIKKAKSEHARRKALYEEERLHVLHEIHTVTAMLSAFQKKIELLEKGLLPLSDQAFRSGQSSYLTGKLEYSTLLNLLRNRFQTRFSYSEAQVDLESAVAELEALLGGPLEEQS